MRYKKIMMLTILIMCLLTVSAVNASENVTDDIVGIENQDNNVISEVDNNVTPKTFTDLDIAINGNNDSDVYLDGNYTFNTDFDNSYNEGVTINRAVTVHGNGYTVDGAETARIFSVSNRNVVFKDIIFVNGNANGNGGAIIGVCTAVNCTFINNSATYRGGAISDGLAVNCTFISNSATYRGGAIYQGSAVNCTFVNNSALRINGDYGGGAIYKGSAVNCAFMGNSAFFGGAMYDGSAVNCTFVGNSADVGGAVIDVDAVNCLFEYNSASSNAGAMKYGKATNCSFNYNNATLYGGAISDGSAVNCTFINNSAFGNNVMYGGGAMSYNYNNLYYCYAVNCTFIGNSAVNGGAIYISYDPSSVVNCTFINNSATNRGGAIGSYETTINAMNCTFAGNSANNNGGAVYDVVVVNSLFEYNSARKGGAMNKGKATDCTFDYNNATDYGGAVFDAKVSTSCQFSDNYAPNGADTFNVTWYEKYLLSFSDLNELINGNDDADVYLNSSYTFDLITDDRFKDEGISVNRNVTVHGNGYTIDADEFARIFKVNSLYNIIFEDIVFANGKTEMGGSAIHGSCTSINCTFINNHASSSDHTSMCGAMYGGSAVNCTFIGNSVTGNGGAMYNCSAVNCIFINNSATKYGGAMYLGSAVNCTFISNRAIDENPTIGCGGAMSSGSAVNCTFINNTAAKYGGAMYLGSAVNCTFINNDYYNVVVTKFDTFISADDVSIAYKDPTGELVATIRNADGNALGVNLNVNFNGEDYTIKADSNGKISLPIGVLSPGTYVATVSYDGDLNYNPSNTTANVVVSKMDTVISAPDVSVAYKDSTGVLVATIRNANGNALGVNLNVNFNGETYTVKANSKGKISIPIGVLSPGTYEATISYEGNVNYNPSSTTADVVVTKADTFISAPDVSVAYKDTSGVLVATIRNANGNALGVNLNVNFNGETYTVKANSKGQISLPIGVLSPGTYEATISYAGNVNYNPSSTTADVVVNRADTFISAPDVSVAYKDSTGVLVATIRNANGNSLGVNLNVNFNGEDYVIKANSKGQISLPIGVLTPGNYIATISYKGNINYNPTSTSANVIVTKANAQISAPDISVAYKDSTGELVATITNAYGKPLSVNVNVNINGVDYAVKADSQGKISIPTAGLAPGSYTATITYNGNVNYNSASTTANIIVNKADTVITAQDVTVKAGDENGKLVATLKNAYGNGLGVNVNVNLNGQDYTIKAGSNGKIVVPTAGLASGSYVATISYKGNVNYNPSSTTANIIVKP